MHGRVNFWLKEIEIGYVEWIMFVKKMNYTIIHVDLNSSLMIKNEFYKHNGLNSLLCAQNQN